MGDGVSRNCECENCKRVRSNTRIPTLSDLVVLSKEDWRLLSKWFRIDGYQGMGDRILDPMQCKYCKVVFNVNTEIKDRHKEGCEVARAEDIMRRLITV